MFRLLCDAGDEVLVAEPSYPLFDFLADLDDVRLRPYPLFYDHGWWTDFSEWSGRLRRARGRSWWFIPTTQPATGSARASGNVWKLSARGMGWR